MPAPSVMVITRDIDVTADLVVLELARREQWATAEARMGFGGLLTALNARWVNDPARLAVANQKPHQLAVAAGCGLAVPESLLTNDPAQARDFCRSHPEGVIYKPLYGGPGSENGHRVALRADTVTADEITDGVRRTSHLFQVRVPCAYAVRLTVVGRRLFAARLDTPAWSTPHPTSSSTTTESGTSSEI